MKGWITLHRKIEENELWLSEPFSRGQAWVDLLLLANHKPQLLYKRNIPITIQRGQVGWSQDKLAKRWKWGRKKVATFLKTLENAQQIILKNNHTLSHIIIVNYDKYQEKEQQSHNRRTTDRTNNNNVNNDNNIEAEASSAGDVATDLTTNGKDMFNRYGEDYELEAIQTDPDYKKPAKKKVSNELQEVFNLFANNPAHKAWHLWPKERESGKILLEAYGIETLRKRVARIQEESKKNDPLFPLITSPSQLLEKMPNVERYFQI